MFIFNGRDVKLKGAKVDAFLYSEDVVHACESERMNVDFIWIIQRSLCGYHV